MTLWFAALLGLVQGLTEFLPVSSTAHLRIVPALLNQPDAGAAFTAVIQLGTLAAVIAYFVKEMVGMIRALLTDRSSPPARMALYIVIGTIPIGLLGVLFRHQIKDELRSLWVVGISLVVVGVIMGIIDRWAKQNRTDIKVMDVILIGLGQACALVPGVSRSGATLSAALLVGMKRDDAARFSFLLSVPAVAAAGLFEMKDAVHEIHGDVGPLIVATAVAFVSGWLTINWFLKFLRTRSLLGFSVYRVLAGGALLVALATGVISAV
jgi:undecaprenyl-diphosphatase